MFMWLGNIDEEKTHDRNGEYGRYYPPTVGVFYSHAQAVSRENEEVETKTMVRTTDHKNCHRTAQVQNEKWSRKHVLAACSIG